MSKELEYVEELKLKYQENGAIRRLNAIEKSLKALEIIKQKAVNMKDFMFYLSLVDQLGKENIIDLCCGCSKTPLTKEDYNLLKEVLK